MKAIYIECRKVDFRAQDRLESEHVACLDMYMHI